MAILLPPIDWGFISRLAKEYDFYFEHGRCIVRLYPRHIKQPATYSQRQTWHNLRVQIAIWRAIGSAEHEAWKRLTQASTWRARDYHARLVLRQLAPQGFAWTSAIPYEFDYTPGGNLRITARILIPASWGIWYRIDRPGKVHSPATWDHIGHKIRNKRFLRVWRLSLDLPHYNPGKLQSTDMIFWVYFPPQPCRIWFQLRAPFYTAPPSTAGQSGLYYFDVPAP